MLIFRRLLKGFICGLAATVPMTVVMVLLHRRLPAQERYPLPPAEVVYVAERKVDAPAGPYTHIALTTIAHFGYGGVAGAIYGIVQPQRGGMPASIGLLYGLLIWAVSYLGILPGLQILRPATQHPERRNALMITAHLVWGWSLAWAYRTLKRTTFRPSIPTSRPA